MNAATAPPSRSSSLDEEEPIDLTQDTAFRMMSCRRRRHVVHYLLQQDDTVSLHELSKQLAAWENDVQFDEVTYKQRMRVYMALWQSHLPKMDDNGVVEFDPNAGEVRLKEDATKLEVYLDIVPHNGIPWSSYYLGLGGLSAALVTTAWFEVFPFDMVSDVAWGSSSRCCSSRPRSRTNINDRRNRLGQEGKPPV